MADREHVHKWALGMYIPPDYRNKLYTPRSIWVCICGAIQETKHDVEEQS